MQSPSPFEIWQRAVQLDRGYDLRKSKSEFKRASDKFYSMAVERREVSKALNEYSTLMDAFALVQEARLLRDSCSYEEALVSFGKAAETLRATIHFGFLAAYVSACTTLETIRIEDPNYDVVEAVKNANALLEQSKLALGFKDENDSMVLVIDSYIKYAISKAFFVDSRNLLVAGDKEGSTRKKIQSEATYKEYAELADKAGLEIGRLDYFPLRDWFRAIHGPLISSQPDSKKLWLLNIGSATASVIKLGDSIVDVQIEPGGSSAFDLRDKKGKIRVVYRDNIKGKTYDEGCLTLI